MLVLFIILYDPAQDGPFRMIKNQACPGLLVIDIKSPRAGPNLRWSRFWPLPGYLNIRLIPA